MNRSLRLFRTGFSVLALAAVGCGSSTPSTEDGGKTDGAAGSKTDGSAGKGGSGGSATGTGASGGAKGGAGGAAAGTSGGTGGAGGGTAGTGGAPPTMLTATVLDRRATTFQLSWTAPSLNGAAVTGYQVRYATVPITATNFDDTTVTTAITYTGTPKAPGVADGITTPKLYIEIGYYFAVEGADPAGDRSPLNATSTAVAAHFLTTVLSGMSGDRMGTDLDGSGDFGQPAALSFTKDGISDLLVGGQGSNNRAFLFLGSASGYSAAPSVTFTGSVAQFGSAIADAGDVDGDGLDDIAIASRIDGTGKIYIYSRKNPPASWGTTISWPTTLTDAQANYVISSAAPLTAGSMDVRNLARLGNFDGVGADDLAIGFDGANATAGAVFVVKGSSSFTSLTIPGTGAIEIDGAAGSAFGASNIGIGPFFASASGGPGLLSAAILNSTVYAFEGQSPAGVLAVAAANDSAVVAKSTDRYGSSLGLLGPIGGSPAAIAVGAPGGGYVDVYLGTAATGPIVGPAGMAPAPTVHFIDSAAGNSFGVITVGGGIKGTSQVLSLIGPDAIPDLVLAGQGESAGQPLYIVDGASLASMSGSVDVSKPATASSVVKISNQVPSDWAGYAAGTIIGDSNDDGHPDFAVGESVTAAGSGRVVVLY
jgi:hypothetical protein